jgi:flagellar biosynthesis protein FlhB
LPLKERDGILYLERGNVPFSREASIFASVSAMLPVGAFLAKDFDGSIAALLRQVPDDAGSVSLRSGGDAATPIQLVAWDACKIAPALLGLFAAAGVLSSVAQNAPHLAFDRIQPNFKRISLVDGWHRLFSLRGQVEFLKGVFKLGAISAIAFTVLQWQESGLVAATAVDPEAIPELILSVAFVRRLRRDGPPCCGSRREPIGAVIFG